jgi:4-amino-4-deoxy-L-arabinose transferase-like glycosyltransferase
VKRLLGCVSFATLLASFELGLRPLYSPAEPRFALIAREMLRSGDWVQPRLGGVRHYEKPPLAYWAIAGAFALFGETEAAARAPSAAAYVGTCALVFLAGRELAGVGTATASALIYATTIGSFLFARDASSDSMFVFFCTLSLFGLARALCRERDRLASVLFFGGMALAASTKGLTGFLFPSLAAVAVGRLGPKPGLLRRLWSLPGAMVAAAVFLPWHAMLAWRDPSFLSLYVLDAHFRRFLNARQYGEFVPSSLLAFWLATLFWFCPWALFLPQALRSALRSWSPQRALPILWAGVVIGFFSVTPARLEDYGLPALPALALLVGSRWAEPLGSHRPWGLEIPSLVFLATAALALPFATGAEGLGLQPLTRLVSLLDGVYRTYFAEHPEAAFAFGGEALVLLRPFVAVLFAVGALSWLAVRRGQPQRAFWVWVAGLVPFLLVVDRGMRLVAADRSQRGFAEVVLRHWEPGAEIVIAGRYEDFCGLVFYADQPARVLDPEHSGLLFGYRKGDAPERFLDRDEFERLWASQRRVFVVGPRPLDLPSDPVVLAEGPQQVLLTNWALRRDQAGRGGEIPPP